MNDRKIGFGLAHDGEALLLFRVRFGGSGMANRRLSNRLVSWVRCGARAGHLEGVSGENPGKASGIREGGSPSGACRGWSS
ncbi:MAG: hypothetical protein ACLR0N_14425 [Bilophila wadsworthia]